ncbi:MULTISPECIES: hypothetical protein [Pseudomonas]|uniref:Uncharacterized protein n=1 Tax=Pseudomonas fluorescens TaxID=294 RepID=A0A5E6SR78_PSEFL|nr:MULTISPECIES: hypothetical protein [Pseudomonas]VVM79845.1 hypothetical protein PS652_02230 [Pseudomonas fluorescens]
MTGFVATDLLPPELPQALGDGLYLDTFPDDIAVLVVPWPGIEEGQKVWLRCLGHDPDGEPVQWHVCEAEPVSRQQVQFGLRLFIDRAQLEALGHESALSLILAVSFDGADDESAATEFPHCQVTLYQALDEAPEPQVVKPLALTQLRIPNLAQPVAGGDGGLNIAALEVSDYGVMVIVEPYLGMAGGDIVEIFWDDPQLPIYVYPLDPDDVGKNLFFYLPRARIEENPGWITAFFRITALDGNSDDSAPLRVLVKLDRPGGIDPHPGEPGHQRLELLILPDEVIEFGVDEALAAEGFDARVPPYEGRVAGDSIRVSWGGVIIRRRVEEEDLLDDIVVFIDPDTIARAGDSENLPVLYKIVDEVHNHSDGWSPHLSIKVDTQGYPLAAPTVLDANEQGYIDLEVLGYDDVRVAIGADDQFAAGDSLLLEWIGRTPDGQLVEHRETVDLEEDGAGVQLLVPNNKVQAIASGLAIVSYQLLPPDGDPVQSRRTTVGVIGEPFGLPAPVIKELDEEGQLIIGLPFVVAEIQPWVGMVNGSWFQLVWRGTTVDGKAYLHEDTFYISGSQAGRLLRRVVRSEHIDLLDGGEVEVSYRIKTERDPDSPIKESEKLRLYVGLSPQVLPSVIVEDIYEDAEGAWLDPDEVTGYATVRLLGKDEAGEHVFQEDDEVIFEWIGETAAGTWTDTLIVPPGAEGEDLRFEVWDDRIIPSNNSVVKIGYRVIREGSRTHFSKPYELWVSNQLRWDDFEVNGWRTRNFEPVTGFAGAGYIRAVRHVGAVTYVSNQSAVRVDNKGKVSVDRAWQGTLIVTATLENGKRGSYSLEPLTYWFRTPTSQAYHYAGAVSLLTSEGWRLPVRTEVAFERNARRNGRLCSEWGRLSFYGWPEIVNGSGPHFHEEYFLIGGNPVDQLVVNRIDGNIYQYRDYNIRVGALGVKPVET